MSQTQDAADPYTDTVGMDDAGDAQFETDPNQLAALGSMPNVNADDQGAQEVTASPQLENMDEQDIKADSINDHQSAVQRVQETINQWQQEDKELGMISPGSQTKDFQGAEEPDQEAEEDGGQNNADFSSPLQDSWHGQENELQQAPAGDDNYSEDLSPHVQESEMISPNPTPSGQQVMSVAMTQGAQTLGTEQPKSTASETRTPGPAPPSNAKETPSGPRSKQGSPASQQAPVSRNIARSQANPSRDWTGREGEVEAGDVETDAPYSYIGRRPKDDGSAHASARRRRRVNSGDIGTGPSSPATSTRGRGRGQRRARRASATSAGADPRRARPSDQIYDQLQQLEETYDRIRRQAGAVARGEAGSRGAERGASTSVRDDSRKSSRRPSAPNSRTPTAGPRSRGPRNQTPTEATYTPAPAARRPSVEADAPRPPRSRNTLSVLGDDIASLRRHRDEETVALKKTMKELQELRGEVKEVSTFFRGAKERCLYAEATRRMEKRSTDERGDREAVREAALEKQARRRIAARERVRDKEQEEKAIQRARARVRAGSSSRGSTRGSTQRRKRIARYSPKPRSRPRSRRNSTSSSARLDATADRLEGKLAQLRLRIRELRTSQ